MVVKSKYYVPNLLDSQSLHYFLIPFPHCVVMSANTVQELMCCIILFETALKVKLKTAALYWFSHYFHFSWLHNVSCTGQVIVLDSSFNDDSV
jgi:hypothetical protein